MILDVALEAGDLDRPGPHCIVSNDDAGQVAHLLTQEQMHLGLSDAGAHVNQLCDAPLPADLLGSGRGSVA